MRFMRTFPYIQTSVFVDSRYAFGGNQLATFWDKEANAQLNKEEMQGIALEMHFSETTFIESATRKDCTQKVRIFTPWKEIPFAGHPTLGTAFVIKQKRLIEPNQTKTVLELGIGPNEIEFVSEDLIRMKQPKPQFLKEWTNRQSMAQSIGLSERDISTKFPMQFVQTGTPYLIVPINSLTAIQRAQPDGKAILKTLAGQPESSILLIATEVVHKDSDVHARMFAPAVGVIEDPATGSAAGPLAAYLEQHQLLPRKQPGEQIIIEQGYEIHRPSQLIAEVIWQRDAMKEVLVSGKVKLVAEGTFYLA